MKARRMESSAGHHAQVVPGHNMRSTEPTPFEPSGEMAVACQKPLVGAVWLKMQLDYDLTQIARTASKINVDCRTSASPS